MTAGSHRPSTLRLAAALLTVYVVWGSTYLGIAVMIQSLPPLLAAGVRYLVAGGAVLVFLLARARVRRQPLERAGLPQWRAAAIVGVLLLLGGNGFVVLAELRIPSGIAAVMISTVPIWMSILDAVVTGHRPSRLAVGGIVAGFVGVVILIAPVSGGPAVDPVGIGLVVIATLTWAIGSIYARSAPMPRSALLGTGMEMLSGGVALFLAGVLTGELPTFDPAGVTTASLLALAYLIVFGSIVAFSAYVWLLANAPISTASTYAYVNPVVAVILGAVILSEPITLRTVVAAVVIIAAVVAMVSGRPRGVEEGRPVPEAASVEG
ncbi:MAG TPA: EamA family transporter [Candidatus Limnocylindria bacterium]|nr:EamA family transporter [Candidatus Limnocylindria bacterium]